MAGVADVAGVAEYDEHPIGRTRARMSARVRRLVLFALLAAASTQSARADALPSRAMPPVSAGAPSGAVQLSDERGKTLWAYAGTQQVVRAVPVLTAPAVAHLRLTTTDGLGFPQVYELLRSFRDAAGTTWFRVRLPMRPNGRTGWAPADAFGAVHLVRRRLLVDRSRLSATLYEGRKVLWSSRIGAGKASTPTPAGHFSVVEKFSSTAPSYGPYAIGTSAYAPTLSDWPGGGVVGIHGTDKPSLIPGRPSHGCIRIRNDAIRRLYPLLPVGTPILII